MSQDQDLLAYKLTRGEMKCPCCGKLCIDPELLRAWTRLRAALARPITIASGYRCPDHNEEVGGSRTSQHLLGKAMDIIYDDVELENEWVYKLLIQSGFRGIGHGCGILHIDVREDPYFWRYTPDGQEEDPELAALYNKLKEQ